MDSPAIQKAETALQRIYELKGRPALKPSAVMFFARAPALESLSELGPRTRAALSALLPGPVTLLLENSSRRFPLACDPGGVAALYSGYACRCFEGPLAALAGVGMPAAQSSANLSGGADPRDLQTCPHRVARKRRPGARRWRASRYRLHRDRPVRVRAEWALADRARRAARCGIRPNGAGRLLLAS